MDDLLLKSGKAFSPPKFGDLVEGRVVSLGRNQVTADIGGKSEGLVASRELTEDPSLYKNLKIGDTILATVIQPENDRGYVVLSLRKAQSLARWRELHKIFDAGQTFAVKVMEFNRGGFLAEARLPESQALVSGFIPLTHLDKSHNLSTANPAALFDGSSLVGQVLDVKIIEIDQSLNRLVFSEKEAKSGMTSQKREEVLGLIKVGEILQGPITAILPFGLFVEVTPPALIQGQLGSYPKPEASGAKLPATVEGLCHVSEVAWEKTEDTASLYKVGQVVQVKVLEVDPAKNKLSLSLKALTINPWDKVAEKFKVGDRVSGVVSKIATFGAFVTLSPGLEGLIHVSETTGPLKVGETVAAEIIAVEPEKQKLGLSIRKIKELSVTYK